MRNFFRRFRRRLLRRKPARSYRPLLEGLESRALLAFNVTLSASSPTANVSITDTATTRTFTATGSGATVKISDIQAAMSNPLDLSVVIDSGSTGTEAGNIICAADMGFTNPV